VFVSIFTLFLSSCISLLIQPFGSNVFSTPVVISHDLISGNSYLYLSLFSDILSRSLNVRSLHQLLTWHNFTCCNFSNSWATRVSPYPVRGSRVL